MSRDFGRNHARQHIAHLAARLMAEDGIEDHGLAKRKAARQAGMSDFRQLPDNDEIDDALRLYRALYCQEHMHELRALRKLALDMMGGLVRFNPHLVGSVLKGNAGKFAVVHLQLFTDDAKSVGLFLINRGIEYKNGTGRLYAGKSVIDAPTLTFTHRDVDIQLVILSLRELRQTLRATAEGKPIERARREVVAALLATD